MGLIQLLYLLHSDNDGVFSICYKTTRLWCDVCRIPRSLRMLLLFAIAEPIPSCVEEKHLHSQAHGFSHGLPADADVVM